MKLKKAKKFLKKLGINNIFIKEGNTEEEISEKDIIEDRIEIDCHKPHDCDDDEVVFNSIINEVVILDCIKTTKKDKKKGKKKKKKEKFDQELDRIKRNLQHIKTGEGEFEESAEELQKREDARQEQIAKQRKFSPRTVSNSNNSQQGKPVDNNHHQNPEANRNNNRRRNNSNYRNRNSSSTEAGTNYVNENPVNENKKEE